MSILPLAEFWNEIFYVLSSSYKITIYYISLLINILNTKACIQYYGIKKISLVQVFDKRTKMY